MRIITSFLALLTLSCVTIYPVFANDLSCSVEPERSIDELTSFKLIEVNHEDLQEANKNLFNAWEAYSTEASNHNLQQLFEEAQNRKTLLLQAMRADSQKALDAALPQAALSELEAILPGCFEKPVSVTGKTIIQQSCFPEDPNTPEIIHHFLKKSDGSYINIYPAQRMSLESSLDVEIQGLQIDQHDLVFQATSISIDQDPSISNQEFFYYPTGLNVISGPGNPPVLGEQKVAVGLLYDPEDPELYERIDVAAIMDDVRAFYLENSYDVVDLNIDIAFPRSLFEPGDCARFDCRFDNCGLNFSGLFGFDNDRIIVFYPKLCVGQGGVSSVGRVETSRGFASVAVVQADYPENLNHFLPISIKHELGHGFGGYHSGFSGCVGPGCRPDRHDPTDIMGYNEFAGHFGAGRKATMGWMEEGRMITNPTAGIYELEPLETTGAGLKALRFQASPTILCRNGECVHTYYELEYRQPIGYDEAIDQIFFVDGGQYENSDVFEGILVRRSDHTFNPDIEDSATPIRNHDLLDFNSPALPWPDTFRDIVLKPGETFVIPGTNVRVAALGPEDGKFLLEVEEERLDFEGPELTILEPRRSTWGRIISGDVLISLDANDPSGISRIEITERSTMLNTSSYQLFAVEPEPGQTHFEIVWDTTRSTNGRVNIDIQAYDRAGERLGGFNNMSEQSIPFSVDNEDPIEPTGKQLAPREGDILNSPVTFRVEAQDNILPFLVYLANYPSHLTFDPNNVWHMQTAGNRGRLIKIWQKSDDSPYEFTADMDPGEYTTQAVVRDPVGNIFVTDPITYRVVDSSFVRGDANWDQVIDIADVLYTLFAKFVENAPQCNLGCDANDDNVFDQADAVYLLEYLFLEGPPPPAPFPEPGIDPTP